MLGRAVQGLALVASGMVRLAELCRRQGRLVEAAALFEQCEPDALASLGRAELAFDRGDMRAAADEAARYLRRVPLQNRTDRTAGLDLLVRALVGVGDLDGAKTALAELTTIANLVATTPLKPAVSLAAGYFARGAGDMNAARQHLEDGVDLFLQCGATFELARARIDLARALNSLGQIETAAKVIERSSICCRRALPKPRAREVHLRACTARGDAGGFRTRRP